MIVVRELIMPDRLLTKDGTGIYRTIFMTFKRHHSLIIRRRGTVVFSKLGYDIVVSFLGIAFIAMITYLNLTTVIQFKISRILLRRFPVSEITVLVFPWSAVYGTMPAYRTLAALFYCGLERYFFFP